MYVFIRQSRRKENKQKKQNEEQTGRGRYSTKLTCFYSYPKTNTVLSVASLGLVSPGAATDGVIPWAATLTVSPLFFPEKLTTYF